MSKINEPTLVHALPIQAHETYAENRAAETASRLPKHPNISLVVPGTFPSATISYLQTIPFFDLTTLSWSFFYTPQQHIASIRYFFSDSYFYTIERAEKKFRVFLANEEKTAPEQECKALSSLFEVHSKIEAMIRFINARRTIQKA